jgi:hypothetical protein
LDFKKGLEMIISNITLGKILLKDPKYNQLIDVYPSVNPEWLQTFYKQQEKMLIEFSGSTWNEFNRDGGFMEFISNLIRA